MSLVQFALRWILMFDAVSCAIPGAKRPDQSEENFSAADLPDIPDDVMDKVESIYNKYIKDSVHHYW
jgi:aryl-alcohol dehydrogenase-like predicted oxidoreductase